MDSSEDLFEELKIKQNDKVNDCSPVEANTAQDLFLAADENLSKILLKKSSMRMEIDVDVEEPDEKELEAVVKTTTERLGDITLRSVADKKEVVEFSQNPLTENKTETLANEEIFKYINDEENKQNDCKLFNWNKFIFNIMQ